MAKIDVSRIEGYDSMSVEGKLKALEAYEYEDFSQEVEKHKNAVSKANSEAAEWKRKHNALLSDEDKRKAEEAERFTAMEKELNELKMEKLISEHKAQFIGLGYDEELATETAKALASGNIQTVFINQKKFMESHDKAIKAETMKNTPTPPAGGAGGNDYQKLIADALAHGDPTSAATYMRLAQQNNS